MAMRGLTIAYISGEEAVDQVRLRAQRLGLGQSPVQLASATSRSEEHTYELQSLMRSSYAVFCLKKKTYVKNHKIPSMNVRHNSSYAILTLNVHTHPTTYSCYT